MSTYKSYNIKLTDWQIKLIREALLFAKSEMEYFKDDIGELEDENYKTDVAKIINLLTEVENGNN